MRFTPDDLLRFRAMAMAQRCMPASPETTRSVQPDEPATPKLPHYARSKYLPHDGSKQQAKRCIGGMKPISP